jgi:chromosome segregation ATPase
MNNSYSFSDVGEMPHGSESSSLAGSHRSLSSILGPPNDTEEMASLKRQLADAQGFIKVVLQVDKIDETSCVRAARQVTEMHSELKKLRLDYKTACDEKEQLERQGDRQARAIGKGDYVSESYEEHLESTVKSMQKLLGQQEAELTKLRKEVAVTKESQNQQNHEEQLRQLRKDLSEAKNEVDELERERDLNLGEIASLTMLLRNAPSQQAASATADYQDLEEARIRVEKLERERADRISKEKELLRRVSEYKFELAKYKDCDSGLDYVDRIVVLEKRLAEQEANAMKNSATNNAEIEKLKLVIQDQTKQSASWEAAASESSAQVLKMASHIEETQTFLAELESENHDLVEQLETAEMRIAELDDKHWLRDQKLAGLTTLYRDTERKLKSMEIENDVMRTSFSNLEVSIPALGFPVDTVRPLEDEGLRKKNKNLRRKVQELLNELERSSMNVAALSKDLEEFVARDFNNRMKIQKLEEEKKLIENTLFEMELRVQATEKKRTNDSSMSLTLGLEAKEVATNTRILKLEQEKRSLERQLLELSEKQAVNERKSIPIWDAFSKGENSSSMVEKIQAELLVAKRELEESHLALESERSARTSDMNKLTKCLEESQAKVAALEKRFERYLGPKPLDSGNEDLGQSSGTNGHGESVATVQELQTQLAAKNEEIRIWEEKHSMQVEQVTGLRDQLTEALTSLEDLEYERNFNNAKVMELTQMNSSLIQSDEEDLHRLLADKAVQCADLATKLTKAEKESADRQERVEKLEMECAINKAKVAELSAIWDSQALDEKARKAVIMKAMEVAEQLNDALLRIEQLEMENEESSAKAAALGAKLSNSVQMVDDLSQKLVAALVDKTDLENKLKAAGVVIGDPDSKPVVRRPMFSFSGGIYTKPEVGEQVKSLAVNLPQSASADLSMQTSPPQQPPAELLSGQL